jgi:transposase
MGCLFSLNPISVAVSRAKALALVFASPRFLDAAFATVEKARLVDALCAARHGRARPSRRRRMIRFLHTADLHLGKLFGRFPEKVRGRLQEAPHASSAQLAAVARHTAPPASSSPVTASTARPLRPRRCARRRTRWRPTRGSADGCCPATKAASPAAISGSGSPATRRRTSGRYSRRSRSRSRPRVVAACALHPAPARPRLTVAMPGAATPAGALGIGLAHGAVQTLSQDRNPALIPPDRAETAGRAFLAVGDWHGQLRIGARCWYAGAPEPGDTAKAAAEGADERPADAKARADAAEDQRGRTAVGCGDQGRPRRRRKKGGEDHAIGRSRGGLSSTKIHAVADRRGLPVRLMRTQGQASDKTTAPELVAPLELTGDVVADRGYFGRAVIEAIEADGATAHIPSQSNVRVVRSVDPDLYRNRNLIERFFNRLKHFRCIATRYNKLARNFLAAVLLASARIWLRHYESTA